MWENILKLTQVYRICLFVLFWWSSSRNYHCKLLCPKSGVRTSLNWETNLDISYKQSSTSVGINPIKTIIMIMIIWTHRRFVTCRKFFCAKILFLRMRRNKLQMWNWFAIHHKIPILRCIVLMLMKLSPSHGQPLVVFITLVQCNERH